MSQNHATSGWSNQSPQVQDAKNGPKRPKTVQVCAKRPQIPHFPESQAKRPRYKMAQMARNGIVLGNPNQNRWAFPVFAMKTAGYHDIDQRTRVLAMTCSNALPVKGPGPPQGAFVPYSFPAGERIAKADSSSDRKDLLAQVSLGSRGPRTRRAKIGGELPLPAPGPVVGIRVYPYSTPRA